MSRKKNIKKANKLNPNSLAVKYEKQILNLEGIKGASTTVIYFKDGSRLNFDLNATNPNPHTVGGENSVAHQVASNVKEFGFTPNQVALIFKDNSRWDFDFSSIPTQSNLQ